MYAYIIVYVGLYILCTYYSGCYVIGILPYNNSKTLKLDENFGVKSLRTMATQIARIIEA